MLTGTVSGTVSGDVRAPAGPPVLGTAGSHATSAGISYPHCSFKELRMRRRQFIAGLGGAVAWPVAAWGQQTDRMRRVGWLGAETENDPQELARLVQELQRLGWIVGRNLQIDRHGYASGESSLHASAAELVARTPDVIAVTGTPLTEHLKQLTRAIPIVFVNVSDPVASGFVASFAHPGGNITGFTSVESSIAGKWLSILKEVAPGATRVMVLYDPVNPNWFGYVRTINSVAPSLNVSVRAIPVTSADEIAHQVETFAREPGGSIIVQPSAMMSANRKILFDLSVRHRLPTMYPYGFYAIDGGLISYGPDFADQFRKAAAYVDRILRGERVSELPVQAPITFELTINVRTAKALGLTIPETLLATADEVIQ